MRKRAYGANFLDGKYPSKPDDLSYKRKIPELSKKNGVRVIEYADGRTEKVISDVDLAFMLDDAGKPMSNSDVILYGKKVNESYGYDVVMHGDNYNGVMMGSKGAKRVANENDTIFIYDKNGLIDSGSYQVMVEKYILKKGKK